MASTLEIWHRGRASSLQKDTAQGSVSSGSGKISIQNLCTECFLSMCFVEQGVETELAVGQSVSKRIVSRTACSETECAVEQCVSKRSAMSAGVLRNGACFRTATSNTYSLAEFVTNRL